MKTKYDYHGALHVDSKGRLVDHNGEVVVLHGYSTHGLSWYPEYVNRDFFQFLRDDWHVDVVRLAMYTAEAGGYCTENKANKEKLKELIDQGVRIATELGLYVIIDWHILSDYNPRMYEQEAKDFWYWASKKYASYGNVFYEICNEPNKCTWKDIKKYAEAVISIIRSNDPYAVIFVGTPVWSQRVDEAVADPVTADNNLMYVLHFYANTHKDELRKVFEDAAKVGLPMFVTEFGTCSADGKGDNNTEEADKWIELLDKYDTGYIMWNISNRDETCASFVPSCDNYTGGYSEDDLREPAKWFVKVLDDHKRVAK